ncbi:hypothetical protein POTOM_005461 [Populus tomentosa]|uniref:Tim10-like domain-containing protein n=1 Tax=Populus tomentosa TaxID=118781 RepID=A0A8X8DFT7_POPTO|nr:hypothetical protein POTOM_005461 [Populus tomentosa]
MAANNVGLPAGVSKEQAYGMAATEMEYRVELFNRLCKKLTMSIEVLGFCCLPAFFLTLMFLDGIVLIDHLAILIYAYGHAFWLLNTCFNKCIDKRHKDAELNMGENSCVDRCVSKYWAVNGIIGQMLSAGQRPM